MGLGLGLGLGEVRVTFLSSAVVTKRLAFSQKVIVFTAARCWS